MKVVKTLSLLICSVMLLWGAENVTVSGVVQSDTGNPVSEARILVGNLSAEVLKELLPIIADPDNISEDVITTLIGLIDTSAFEPTISDEKGSFTVEVPANEGALGMSMNNIIYFVYDKNHEPLYSLKTVFGLSADLGTITLTSKSSPVVSTKNFASITTNFDAVELYSLNGKLLYKGKMNSQSEINAHIGAMSQPLILIKKYKESIVSASKIVK